ncbi:MAG TPA: helix-turn-helix domain-containing protein [Candidatus Nanoarchaeia archaeon]|nr:helix-turn-helix domain-containing protein [Candidatus Nanoarchaeia archaeon]
MEDQSMDKSVIGRKDLEQVVKKKVRPILESAMQKFIGITIDELAEDISSKIGKTSLLNINIDTSLPFKKAKKKFAAAYLRRLLEITYGNVSETARIAGVDRRSVHRLVKDSVNVPKIRQEMRKAYDVRQEAVGSIIEGVLEGYKGVVAVKKLDNMYRNVPEVSKEIVDQLPARQLTLSEAEEEFEKEYLLKALAESKGNVSMAARKIGLRYETLHRKVKSLGLEGYP